MTPCTPSTVVSVAPVWRHFADLPPFAAAFVTACWNGDSTPLQVTCMPGKTSFTVMSSTPLGAFHWAVFSARGIKLDGGWETMLAEAQRVAVEAQSAWSHRCIAKEKCHCAMFQR